MALGKKIGAVIKLGGGDLQFKEVPDNNQATLDLATALSNPGYIQESTLKDEEANPDIVRDETGNVVTLVEGDLTAEFSGLFMQTDKDLIDAIKGLRGKFVAIKYTMGKINDAGVMKTQTLIIPCAKLVRNIEVKSGTKRIPFRFVILPALKECVVTGPAATIPAGEYYDIVEA